MYKKLFIALLILLGLLVGTLVAVAALVDANRLKPQIEALVLEHTGRALTIRGDLALSVFPRIAVNLPETSLSDTSGQGQALSVKQLRLSAAWWPLLKGRLELGQLAADGLSASLERYADGSTNMDDLMGPKANATDPLADSEGRAPPLFEVGGIILTDAHLTVIDQTQQREIRLSNLNLETGRLGTRSITPVELQANYALTQPPSQGRLELEGTLFMDLAAGAYGASELAAQLKGTVGKQPLDIALKAGRLEVHPGAENLALSSSQLRLDLKGPIAGMQIDAGHLAAKRLDLDPVLLEFNINELDAELRGSRDADRFDLRAHINGLYANREEATGDGIDAQLKLSGTRTLEASIDLQGIAGKAQAMTASHLGIALSTRLKDDQGHERSFKLQLGGPLRGDLPGRKLSLPSFSGALSVGDARLPKRGYQLPLKLSGEADLTQETLQANLSTHFDNKPAHADIAITGLLGEGAQRHIRVQAQVEHLNLDQYLALASGSKNEAAADKAKPPAARATPIDWSILRDLNLAADLRIGQLQAHGLKAANAIIGIKAAKGELTIKPLTAGLYGGSLNAWATATADQRLDVFASMVQVDIAPLLKDVAGKDILAGRGTVKLDLNTSGNTTEQLRRELNGLAGFALRDGALKGINLGKVLRQAREQLDASDDTTTREANAAEQTDFSELSGSFQIRRGIARNYDLDGKSPLLRLAGQGKIDLTDLTIDYTARVSLVGTSEGQGGRELSELRGATIPVRLSGALDAPTYTIDWSTAAKQALREKARERLEEKIAPKRDEIKDRFRSLLGL